VRQRELPHLGAWSDLVRQAIDTPIGSPPLRDLVRPGMRIAILLTDVHDSIFGTRDRVGPMLLDYLNAAGVPDQNVSVIHAAGLHGHADAIQRVGREVLDRVHYLEHDPLDDASLAFHGVTTAGTPVWINRHAAAADMIIGFGGCNPSLFGFQGGGGIILPGISGADTIRHNHTKMMTTVRTISGWWPNNPQRLDVMEAADLVGFRFKIDITANTVFAGYFRAEWPVAVQYIKDHVLTRVPPCDIYVHAPAHSRELPNSIYMAIEYGTRVVRPGGIAIVCASAADHTPAPPRPVSETLDETLYVTRQWNAESGEGDQAIRAYWRKRDQICKEELMQLSVEDLSRILTRRRGEPRTTTMAWSHRNCLEHTRTFLVTEGISAAEGEAMGFAYVTRSFDDAFARARDEVGANASVVANLPPHNGLPYLDTD
jgi:hypothetical protein